MRPASVESLPADSEKLEGLARRYGVPVTVAHHALADAYVTALVWQRLLWAVRPLGVRTLGELARIAGV